MPSTALNHRLSSSDASFLYTERPGQPMHVGSINVYEGHVSREDVIAVLSSRLHQLPRYRQRVVFPPFGIAHPTWEDDPDFDINNHVVEVTLPAPGDQRTLSREGGREFAKLLDRNRPLWKLVLLQGAADGNTAMIAMIHHAMVDGVSGVEMQMVMHDVSARAEALPPPQPWTPKPFPTPLSQMQSALTDLLTEAALLWTEDAFRVFRPREISERTELLTSTLNSMMPSLLRPAPRTTFNGPISAEREFAWFECAFSDIRAIRNTAGGTVNDVVLAVLAGAFRRYLQHHGNPVDEVELRAMCPVSMRPPDQQQALGNLVSIMLAPLFVGIADPLERLGAERTAMERLKGQGQAAGLYALTDMTRRIPPAVQAFTAGIEAPQTLLNTVSTNVPGPQIPLFLAGHKLAHWYPLGPLGPNMGIFVAILSYNQRLTIGPTVDPKQVPDVWLFVDFLRDSFDELSAAAKQLEVAPSEPVATASPMAVAAGA